MLRFPNTVRSVNWNLVCSTEEPVDLRCLVGANIPALVDQALDATSIVITYARVQSNFFGNDRWTAYDELLIKVLIQDGDQTYVFPVHTYVNDLASLERGVLLSFQKSLAGGVTEPIALDGRAWSPRDVPVSIDGITLGGSGVSHQLDVAAYAAPFVVFGAYDGKLYELMTDSFEQTSEPEYYPTATGSGMVLGTPFTIAGAWKTGNTFKLYGLAPHRTAS